ncbi:aminotransferase class IV [Pelagibacteraceae bacterium]|nr:aminotransferase class IV [Pelagibacteraceae bacterium]
MENILLRKSYHVKDLKTVKFNSLWGYNGVFTTIRISGKKPNLVLIDQHLKKLNKDSKFFGISFKISKQFLINFINTNSKIKNYDHLLRVAVTKKLISLSLRKRNKEVKNFNAHIYRYQRSLPSFKNLQYKKILSLQKKINLQKEEILFYNKSKILEGSTTNLIFVKNNQLFIPKDSYYFGITLSYLIKTIPYKIKKIDISISNFYEYSEILLVGSGKGVVSISSIDELNWYRSSLKMYKSILKEYSKVL